MELSESELLASLSMKNIGEYIGQKYISTFKYAKKKNDDIYDANNITNFKIIKFIQENGTYKCRLNDQLHLIKHYFLQILDSAYEFDFVIYIEINNNIFSSISSSAVYFINNILDRMIIKKNKLLIIPLPLDLILSYSCGSYPIKLLKNSNIDITIKLNGIHNIKLLISGYDDIPNIIPKHIELLHFANYKYKIRNNNFNIEKIFLDLYGICKYIIVTLDANVDKFYLSLNYCEPIVFDKSNIIIFEKSYGLPLCPDFYFVNNFKEFINKRYVLNNLGINFSKIDVVQIWCNNIDKDINVNIDVIKMAHATIKCFTFIINKSDSISNFLL
jgi:hypothetical protein